MEEYNMKIIYVEPERIPTVREIDGTLEEMARRPSEGVDVYLEIDPANMM